MRMRGTLAYASLLCLGLTQAAAAQAPAPKMSNQSPTVAVIQFQPAVTATNEFQRDFAALAKKFEPKRTELKTLTDEIDTLTRQLQADGQKLSEPEQAARARVIDDKKKQAQRLAEDDQNDYNQAVQELYGRVASKVDALLATYAKDRGFTLVMDRTEQQQEPPVVLYAEPSTDITRQIVDAYNQKSGAPAPEPPAAPAPAPKPSPSE